MNWANWPESDERNLWPKEQRFTKTIAKFASISEFGDRVSSITFNKEPRHEINFSDHKTYDGFADAVDNLRYRQGGTNIAGALRLALDEMFQSKNGMRSDSVKTMILITDGKESDDIREKNVAKYPSLREEFKARNIHLVVVGVGKVDMETLRELVLDDKDFLFAEDFDVLIEKLTSQIVYTVCPGSLSITIRNEGDLF